MYNYKILPVPIIELVITPTSTQQTKRDGQSSGRHSATIDESDFVDYFDLDHDANRCI